MKSISIAEARNHLTEWLRQVESGDRLGICRRGEPVAVLMSLAEFERLSNAAAAVDFAAWTQAWRERQPAGFDGIGRAEVERWQELL